MKRYEQSIRVLAAFFAVLLGFGLKKLLDGKPETNPDPTKVLKVLDEVHSHPAPFFVLSVLLFLRFLLGSANHSWHDYVLPDSKETVPFKLHPTELIRDLLFLVTHGLLGIAICYSTTVDHFFKLHLWFAGIAVVWVLFYIPHGWLLGRKVDRWWLWLLINFLQGAAIVFGWQWARFQNWGKLLWPEDWFGEPWDRYLLMLVAAYTVILVLDVWFQLSNLDKAKMPKVEQDRDEANRKPDELPEKIGELTKAIISLAGQLKGLPEKQVKVETTPPPANKTQVTE